MYFGIVKNNIDPLQLGRVKVNVFGLHDNIETKDLGWSQVIMPANTPAISGKGHSVNLAQEILWKKGELLPEPITTPAPEFKVLTEVDNNTTPATGDVKVFGSLVCGIFLDNAQQEFMVIGSLPTKTDGVEDNNVRVRAGADPNTEDPVGSYQPPSTYAPVYPYNNVYETESGHVKEYDDTPGVERITERHKSGTRYEIDPNGTKNETIVRDNYKLVAGHDTLEVYGNVKIVVSGDVDIAVAGSLTASVTGNIAADSQGDITLKATETDKKIILDGDVDVTKVLRTNTDGADINLNTHIHTQPDTGADAISQGDVSVPVPE
jgi:hypothetical protein